MLALVPHDCSYTSKHRIVICEPNLQVQIAIQLVEPGRLDSLDIETLVGTIIEEFFEGRRLKKMRSWTITD